MNPPRNDIRELFVSYFRQQLELYGPGYSISTRQLDTLKKALAARGKAAGSPVPAQSSSVWPATLDEFNQKIKNCTKCSLGHSRTEFVFGIGNRNADAMLIGEAPGAEEDRAGEPFVGLAGQLLTKMLSAINLNRDEVFIANILKCRPPNNRDPQPEEVEQCEPYLHHQIHLIQPRVILALGRISGQTLLKTGQSLAQLRGKLHSYRNIPMVVTYHPAALLRNPNWKYPAWDDLRYFHGIYQAVLNGKSPRSVAFKTEKRNPR